MIALTARLGTGSVWGSVVSSASSRTLSRNARQKIHYSARPFTRDSLGLLKGFPTRHYHRKHMITAGAGIISFALLAPAATDYILCEGTKGDDTFRYKPSPHVQHQLRFTDDGSSRNGHDYPSKSPTPQPPPNVSYYDLSFGTAAGICTGLFVRKLGKAIAIVLGGCFVFLQYCRSKGIVKVNWQAMSNKYGEFFTSNAGRPGQYAEEGRARGQGQMNIVRAWNWMVDFLVADFQFRASFIPGFVLGLRMG